MFLSGALVCRYIFAAGKRPRTCTIYRQRSDTYVAVSTALFKQRQEQGPLHCQSKLSAFGIASRVKFSDAARIGWSTWRTTDFPGNIVLAVVFALPTRAVALTLGKWSRNHVPSFCWRWAELIASLGECRNAGLIGASRRVVRAHSEAFVIDAVVPISSSWAGVLASR